MKISPASSLTPGVRNVCCPHLWPGLPSSSDSFRMMRIFSPCSLWVPWEKLSLATAIPWEINSFMTSGDSLAGPMVHTIFVFVRDLAILFLYQASKPPNPHE